MKKTFLLSILVALSITGIFAQNALIISSDDIRLTQDGGNDFETATGYHLFIRKKSGIESVMLTETTKDPEGVLDNYAYRAKEWNSVNGDEKRILDGKILESEGARYSLVDTSVEDDEVFGKAFHIFIPSEMIYGYSWSRNGTVKIGRGTFINIRAFEKPYCDYTGNYFDNPYMFNLETRKKEIPVIKSNEPKKIEEPVVKNDKESDDIEKTVTDEIYLTDDYSPLAAEKFKEISDFLIYSKGPETIVDDILNSMERINPKNTVDVVFAIDATGSMKDDIQKLREEWVPRLLEKLKDFGDVRLGLVLYRDYGENFYTRGLPVKYFDFTTDVNVFLKSLNSFKIRGTEGGDIPEAVYEALFASMDFFQWRVNAEKKIILIGDAEPHPTPRGSGKYSKALIQKMSIEKKISIDAIITPDDKGRRGR